MLRCPSIRAGLDAEQLLPAGPAVGTAARAGCARVQHAPPRGRLAHARALTWRGDPSPVSPAWLSLSGTGQPHGHELLGWLRSLLPLRGGLIPAGAGGLCPREHQAWAAGAPRGGAGHCWQPAVVL